MAKNPYEEALNTAEEILATIQENKSLSVTNLLRRCARIAELLELDDILWINNELKGYPDDDVPPYRSIEVKCHYSRIGKLLPVISMIRERRDLFYKKWKEKIAIRTSSVTLELWTKGGHSIELRRKTIFGMDVTEVAVIQAEQTWEILHRIVDKIREFVSRISIDLKFGGRVESIFSESRKFVDRKLSEICPSVLSDLETTYEKAIQSDSPLEWSQVAFACRQILQDFTDSIYIVDYLPEGETSPTKKQTLKKVRFILMAKLASSKRAERKLIESQIKYLIDYITKLNVIIQKNIHPEKYKVQKEDAHRCIIYTYLIIGDVLRLL